MSTLLVDCETFSELDVREVGSFVYANHPSTRVLMWSVRDPSWARSLVFDEPNIWALLTQLKKAGQIEWTKNEPLDLVHWSPFDRHIVQYGDNWRDHWEPDAECGAIKGPNNTYWCDLSELSLIYGGPAGLKNAAAFWGNEDLKDEGKHLISRFCKPSVKGINDAESDPIRWEQFRSYAGQDTNVMLPMLARFEHLAMNGGEDLDKHWPYIRCVGRMNERGVPIDRTSARIAYDNLHAANERLTVECEKRYGFKPTSVKLIAEYLGTEDCRKETLTEYIEANRGRATQRDLANIRLLSGGAASKKLAPMLRRSTVDGRVHDCFIYNGAWTRRLTSSGVQFQNMLAGRSDEAFFKRLANLEYAESDLIFEEARENIRGFVKAEKTNTLVAADYSQVELRVGAWLAGEDWLLDLIRRGDDPYLEMATMLYSEPVTDKKDPRRQFGKIVELASLFGLGRFGLQTQAGQKGIELTELEAQDAINVYRRVHPAIVRCWQDCQAAFMQAMGGSNGEVGPIRFERLESAVKVVRPSGFAQYYWLPHYVEGHWPNCTKPGCGGCKTEIHYQGRIMTGAMADKTTYGGDIFQGIVQGTAADLMLDGMLRADMAGFETVMSIHDEVVAESGGGGCSADYEDELCTVINILPTWAEGLPIASEGWQQDRFTK